MSVAEPEGGEPAVVPEGSSEGPPAPPAPAPPAPEPPFRRALDIARRVGVLATLLAASVIFVWFVNGHTPIGRWLFWRYAGYFLACAVFAVACLSAGHVS